MTPKRVIVAIDGPAGAGKSTLAKRIAEKLGYIYINTGSMYRAVALWAMRLEISPQDAHKLEQLAKEARIELDQEGRVRLNGEDVTAAIRDQTVADVASLVSALPAVRRALLGLQRKIAEQASVVMEGRDIGSVIFPDAQVKIYLDADPAERARRRTLQLDQTGSSSALTQVTEEMKLRDERDRRRSEAPLVQAPDAQLVDTTNLSLDQVEAEILRIVRARTSNGKASSH